MERAVQRKGNLLLALAAFWWSMTAALLLAIAYIGTQAIPRAGESPKGIAMGLVATLGAVGLAYGCLVWTRRAIWMKRLDPRARAIPFRSRGWEMGFEWVIRQWNEESGPRRP